MIVAGQTEARSSTIIDYRAPFDQGFSLFGFLDVLVSRSAAMADTQKSNSWFHAQL